MRLLMMDIGFKSRRKLVLSHTLIFKGLAVIKQIGHHLATAKHQGTRTLKDPRHQGTYAQPQTRLPTSHPKPALSSPP